MPLFHISDNALFQPDSLSWVMAGLIIFVVANVIGFSSRYMAGDRNYHSHCMNVLLLGASVLVMALAGHLLVLLAGWTASNLILVKLMIHKPEWKAARNAGLLALKTFGIGFLLLAAGFWLLAESAGTASIREINEATLTSRQMSLVGLVLVAVAAMTQSATWPFHRWLTSSLNSPTPVSALMHAGLVNGGGFLLVRFAPLYLAKPVLLHLLFVAGLVTAVVGTFWKLLQPDIKRMLACSTMGQMGFMLMQCGMGLFAPAVSHLCWHGLFKAYLFLSVGSAIQEKPRSASSISASSLRLALACLSGMWGAAGFSLVSGIGFSLTDTTCLMTALAFMAAAQLSLGLLTMTLKAVRVAAALLIGLVAGCLYGFNVRLIEMVLASMNVNGPQPLDGLYGVGFSVIFLVWLAMNLNLPARVQSSVAWRRLYVAALNGSQPSPQTVTATRTAYQS